MRDSAPELRMLQVVAFAMTSSVVLYVAIAWILVAGPGELEPLGADLPRVVLGVMVAAAVLCLLAPLAIEARSDSRGSAATASRAEISHAARIRTIVAYALRETAAILGFVLTLLTGQVAFVAGLGFAAFAAMVVGWPRASRLASGPIA